MSELRTALTSPEATQAPKNGLGVAALVLGIIGLVIGIFMVTFGFALVLGILGLVLGLVALRRLSKGRATNRGVSIAGTIAAGLSIVLGIVGAVVTATAVSGAVDAINKPMTSSDGDASGPGDSSFAAAFPGATPQDVVKQAGETADADGVQITTTSLEPGDDTLGDTLCTTATYSNNSEKAASFNGGFDWKLQDPNGVILPNSFTGSSDLLSSGELATGGNLTADVCFNAPATSIPGQYVVLLDPTFRFSSDRIAWLNTL